MLAFSKLHDYNKQMKTIIYALLSVCSLVATAAAGTPLIVDTLVTDTDAHGKDKVLGRFHVLTEDGRPVVVPVGERSYAVVPTLRGNGTVDLAQTMTHPTHSGKVVALGPYQQNQTLGESREISFGSVTYSTKVSKPK